MKSAWVFSAVVLVSIFLGWGQQAGATLIPLTILHTNDIHSHYKPNKGPFGLGGIARIATTIRRERAQAQNSILLDGGDWSEGNIYYNLDAGRTALEVMNALGYDAAVVGNHDWLNGPDRLMTLFKDAPPRFPILGANLDFSKYSQAAGISKFIEPYTILKVGGLKIGVIGLCTYELIYDKFFAPVAIKDPFGLTKRLAAKLKKVEGVDLVIVISHNGMAANKLIAATANVDIVIHAHDHVKLPQPLVVEHNGKTAIMVEAHQWGNYVGKLQIVFDTDTKKWSMTHYELIQQDSTIPDDPSMTALVNNYDQQIAHKYGDIFHDHLAEAKIDVRRESTESLFGNLLTDAYREYVGADVSFEQTALTSAELYRGPLSTVDIYNSLTQIWNPSTDKSWTLKTMRMTGETLSWVLNLVLGATAYIPGGMLSVSGLHLVYDPMVVSRLHFEDAKDIPLPVALERLKSGELPYDDEKQMLKSLEIGGKPVDPKKEYLVAVPDGINQAIDFMETFLGKHVPRTDVRDTGAEDWRVLAAYLAKHPVIGSGSIGRGGRVTVLESDLALYYDEVRTWRRGARIMADVTVRNFGAAESVARTLKVTYDKTPLDTRDDPNPADIDNSFAVPPIPPGGSYVAKTTVVLPQDMAAVPVPIYFQLNEDKSDPNKSNDGTWVLVDVHGHSRQNAQTQAAPAAVFADHD